MPSRSRTQENSRATSGDAYGGLFINRLVSSSRDVEQELFGPSPKDWRRLTARCKRAETWGDLKRLLPASPAEWDDVDTICLTAAFSALGRVVVGRHAAAASEPSSSSQASADAEMSRAASLLIELVRARLPEFDVQGLVTVGVSVAKMREECLDDSWLCALTSRWPDLPAATAASGSNERLVSSLYDELLHYSSLEMHR